jgi:gluconate 2-dehydrogenase alpha chain
MSGAASADLGYHPFPQPAAILSQAYVDISGRTRSGCLYCGFCVRFGCEVDAKASANASHIPIALRTGRYEIRTNCRVIRINIGSNGLATGVTYIDQATGEEHEQPADVVIVSAFTLENVRLLLLSRGPAHPNGIGNDRGMVGQRYSYQLDQGTVTGVFEGRRFNTYMGNSCLQNVIHDFNADNFDHSDLDFVGGASISAGGGEREPLGSTLSMPELDAGQAGGADGLPLLRVTFDFHQNDYNLYRFMAQRCAEIMRRMNPTRMSVAAELEPYNIYSYQSTHNTGGAIMGSDPGNSVTNKYGQVWDTPNVFVTGAALYPQNPGMNPTGTLLALSYWTAHALKTRYFNEPNRVMS